MSTATLIIAHGSREAESNQGLFDLLHRLREKHPKHRVVGAFLELAEPTIPDAIEQCITAGATEIFVLPLMFFPGRHVRRDIPRFLEEAKTRHPKVIFHYGGHLADHPLMITLLNEKIRTLAKENL